MTYARIKAELSGLRIPTKESFLPLSLCTDSTIFRAVQREIDDDFDTLIRTGKGAEVYNVRSLDFDFYNSREQAKDSIEFSNETITEGDDDE